MEKAISDRDINITVVGLGKMGLPIAMVFTNAGFTVKGLDISEDTVNMLNSGKTLLEKEVSVQSRLQEAVDKGKFRATTDIEEAVKDASFVITIIPVLTDNAGNQDLQSLLETYEMINHHAPNGVVYIQESTLAPGTTSGVIKQTLEKPGKKSGDDFGLVFSPERTYSGRAIPDIEENYPKIVGGDTENAAIAAKYLYDTVAKKGVITVTNATTAEAVKTFKGAYRDANIAIANQLALLADAYGVDITEVIEAANTEPFSHIHTPGIGVGGHCIPVYPQFIISGGKERGIDSDLLVMARNTNLFMVDYAIQSIEKYVDSWDINVLVHGLAYRGGVKEFRNSPTLRIVPRLRGLGAKVTVEDPMFTPSEIDQLFGEATGITKGKINYSNYSIIIIVTDHDGYSDLEDKIEDGTIVFDGRYVLDVKHRRFKVIQPGRKVHL